MRDAVLPFNVGSTVTVVLPWDCQASVGGLSRFSTIPSVFVPLSVGLLVPLDLLYRRSGRGVGSSSLSIDLQSALVHSRWLACILLAPFLLPRSFRADFSNILIGIVHFL